MSSKIWHGLLAAFALVTLAVGAVAQQPPSIGKQQLFPTPEAAADALNDAAKRGDSKALAQLLAEGFERYPDLYRPLTTERNRRWLGQVEGLLDDREDYLVVVGTLHLVGKDSLIDLLEGKGHRVLQH